MCPLGGDSALGRAVSLLGRAVQTEVGGCTWQLGHLGESSPVLVDGSCLESSPLKCLGPGDVGIKV